MRIVRFLVGGALLLPFAVAAQDARRSSNTALVNESPEANRVVARAAQLEAAGRYAEALSIYQDAIRRYPNTVISLDRIRGRGIWDYVRGRVELWPEEGKAAYRKAVDPVFEGMFQAAKREGDAEELERLVDEYPYSGRVPEALALAANLHFEQASYERAAAALVRLLDAPGDISRPVIFARLGLAQARRGRRDLLERLIERAGKELPDATVTIGGEAGLLDGTLRGLLEGLPEGGSPSVVLELPGWEMQGGAPDGSRLAESGVALGPLAWNAEIGSPRFDTDDTMGVQRGMDVAPPLEFRPLFPVVAEGVLYVHNDNTLSAYNLFSRQSQLLWQQRIPPPVGEIMFEPRLTCTPTVHAGRVYAALLTEVTGAEDQLGYVRVKFPFPRRALYAFDALTGKSRWKLGGEVRSETFEGGFTFSTGPTPEGDRLYVGAIRQQFPTDPFEHYVLCLEAATGKILWSTFVASGGTEINLFGNSTRESLASPISASGDAVFIVTNHGVAAALEKKTGRLRWTYRYTQYALQPTRNLYVSKQGLGWMNSPPLVIRGVAVVTPTDAPAAYGLDARTGELLWERPREADLRTLYGAREGTVVAGGERLEFWDVATGKLLARTKESRGSGRGVVADDGVYVPGVDGLHRAGWDGSWSVAGVQPWTSARSRGGNLLVVDGAVILAGYDSIQVYFNPQGQEAAVREAIAKAPDDLSLIYRGALRLLQSGKDGEAESLLARVVDEATASAQEGLRTAARRRLWGLRMDRGRVELEARRFDAAAEAFIRAQEDPPDDMARVEASLMHARVREARGDAVGAVAEYHGLLAAQGDERLAEGSVFDLARTAVDAVIRSSGRDVYAIQEQEAVRRLDAARKEGTPEALTRVFRSYPNSRAAERALFEQAAVYGRLGRTEEEAEALRRMIREFPESPLVPEAYASLVMVLERQGRHGGAETLLRRMARDFPEGEVSEGAGKIRVREFVDRRLRDPAYAALGGRSARLVPPLKRVFQHIEGGVRGGLPLKIEGPLPADGADLLVMNFGKQLEAFDVRQGRRIWRLDIPGPVQFAGYEGDGLLLGWSSGVWRVALRDGVPMWRYAAPAPLRGFAMLEGLLACIAADPRGQVRTNVFVLDPVRGTEVWTRPVDGVPLSKIHGAGPGALFLTAEPFRLHLYETDTGKQLLPRSAALFDIGARIVHASENLILMYSPGKSLDAYSLPGGAARWKLALRGVNLRAVEADSEAILFLGIRVFQNPGEDPAFLAVVDPQEGKISCSREGAFLANALFLLRDGPSVVVVSRESEGAVAVRGLDMKDLSVGWTATFGGPESSILPPVLTKDHVVVPTVERSPMGKFAYVATLLDKSGRTAQNMRSEYAYERPPECAVVNDFVVFSADGKVDVYR